MNRNRVSALAPSIPLCVSLWILVIGPFHVHSFLILINAMFPCKKLKDTCACTPQIRTNVGDFFFVHVNMRD
jgi:hypothetical protein